MNGIIDTTTADSVRFGFKALTDNQGGTITIAGIGVVFLGLILIAIVIYIFNSYHVRKEAQKTTVKTDAVPAPAAAADAVPESGLSIPADDLAAITAAIELYRRLHYDRPESKVTFERGEASGGWKIGVKVGQRPNQLR